MLQEYDSDDYPDILVKTVVSSRALFAINAVGQIIPPNEQNLTYKDFDTTSENKLYEIGVCCIDGTTNWLPANEHTWRSWIGERRINGSIYHGAVFITGTNNVWSGIRDCSCKLCQEHIVGKFRHN